MYMSKRKGNPWKKNNDMSKKNMDIRKRTGTSWKRKSCMTKVTGNNMSKSV